MPSEDAVEGRYVLTESTYTGRITIGICAFNEKNNIGALFQSILMGQKLVVQGRSTSEERKQVDAKGNDRDHHDQGGGRKDEE